MYEFYFERSGRKSPYSVGAASRVSVKPACFGEKGVKRTFGGSVWEYKSSVHKQAGGLCSDDPGSDAARSASSAAALGKAAVTERGVTYRTGGPPLLLHRGSCLSAPFPFLLGRCVLHNEDVRED